MNPNVKVTGIPELQRNIKNYLKDASTVREKHSILRPGAVVIRNAAKKKVRKSKKNHFYYRKGNKVEIESGNLRNSIYAFKHKIGEVSVGPRVLRSLAGRKSIGTAPANSSGYYAHMLYQTAEGFRDTITWSATMMNLDKVDKAMEKALERFNKRIAKKYGFQ